MSEAVLLGLIAAAGTVLSGIIGAYTANKMVNYRLEQLEKKVDKHNNLIERTYELEKNIAVIKEDVENIKEND